MFDSITKDDLIVAFFPCIEFSCLAQFWFSLSQPDYKKWKYRQIFEYMLAKNQKRADMFSLLYKFVCVVMEKKIRMVFENPWSMNTYLKQNVFLKPPTIIDNNRTLRGDVFVKPTAYWFWNCEPTRGFTYQPAKKNEKTILWCKKGKEAGICSEERSMISHDYARNWICDFILGKKQEIEQLSLF